VNKSLSGLMASLFLLCAASAAAAQKESEIRLFKTGEPINIASDKAYVAIRLDIDLAKYSTMILRVPSRDEIDAYEAAKKAAYDKKGAKAGPYESFVFDYQGRPNFLALDPSKRVATAGKLAVMFAEIPAGDYVLYGEGFGGYLYQCFCFGTVGFKAEPGKVVDLGTILVAKAWEPSAIPELAGEVDLGRTAVMDYGLLAVALRPLQTGDTAVPGLDQALISRAQLHAVGPFVETNTTLANRLAAIPGVLAYDNGRVIDVASGSEALPN